MKVKKSFNGYFDSFFLFVNSELFILYQSHWSRRDNLAINFVRKVSNICQTAKAMLVLIRHPLLNNLINNKF
jgi:hypothetical protein